MGFHNGKYNGRIDRWKPYFIDGCKLWLDGADESTMYQESGVALWVDKSVGRSSWSVFSGPLNPTYALGITLTSGQSVKGTDGWVRAINTTGSSRHQCNRLNIYTYSDNRSRLTFTYYVPLNSAVQGLYLGCANNNGTNYGYVVSDFEKGKIKTFTRIFDKRARNVFGDDFVVGTLGDGGAEVYAGSTDEVWYVKNYIDEKWDGNSVVQLDNSIRPTYSNGIVSFNGSDEFLDLTAYLENFSGDTQGELFAVFKRDLQANQTYVLSYGTSSTNQNALLFDHASTGATTLPNDIRVYSDASGSQHAVGFDSDDTDMKIVSWSSNGSSWRIFRNGTELSLTTSGSNSGRWFSDIPTGDGLYIGRWAGSTSAYGDVQIKEIIYYDHQLTNKQRLAVTRYLNSKHSIY